MDADRKKLVDKIMKLFALGNASANNVEAETLAAVTKAREMMARHQISMAEIEMAKGASAADAVRIHIQHHRAYTRKVAELAQYDYAVAEAVSIMCDCRWYLNHPIGGDGKKFTSVVFLGDEADVALASELFMIWLQSVRKAARQAFGGGKNVWTPQHTSYAVGFGVRLCDRAKEQVRNLNVDEQKTWALVVANKSQALSRAWDEMVFTKTKERKKKAYDSEAYSKGYLDGGKFNMGKKILTGQENPYDKVADDDEDFHRFMDGANPGWRLWSRERVRDAAKRWQQGRLKEASNG